MAPSINLYNNQIQEDGNDIWACWSQMAPGVICMPDLSKYALLCTYLGDTVEGLHLNDLYFCDSHTEMVTKTREWVKPNQTFNICNIDHHHDTGYQPNDNNETWEKLVENPGCGNWVSVLKQQYGDRFLSYVWLANENSDFELRSCIPEHYKIYKPTTDIYELAGLHFDKVFVCCSTAWVPPDYRYLFESMRFLLEKIANK